MVSADDTDTHATIHATTLGVVHLALYINIHFVRILAYFCSFTL